MSIFGHFNNFFFAAHLLDIAMGFKTLRTILSSVTHNGKQVLALATRGRQKIVKERKDKTWLEVVVVGSGHVSVLWCVSAPDRSEEMNIALT